MKTETTGIGPPDVHHLSSAIGWMELGNLAEALADLERIGPALRNHPQVLEARWLMHAKNEDWENCLLTAQALVEVSPEDPGGWIHRAYSLRRVKGGGLQAACEALLPAAERFPGVAVIPYNLACYLCRMGRMEQCRHWLEIAFKTGEPKTVKKMALADEDLRELWPELGGRGNC